MKNAKGLCGMKTGGTTSYGQGKKPNMTGAKVGYSAGKPVPVAADMRGAATTSK